MSRARMVDGRREVKVTNPVCGMQVRAAAARVTHEGREFYFWSVACSDKFVVDPAKYFRSSDHGPDLTPATKTQRGRSTPA
jgi:YHS domain-containing protein